MVNIPHTHTSVLPAVYDHYYCNLALIAIWVKEPRSGWEKGTIFDGVIHLQVVEVM